MRINKAPGINQLWANLLVEELIRHGANQFVLSPGSRCTPLTAAVAFRKDVGVIKHFDERGAAYFAIGYARGAGKPATLVCTSGTATANYFPAIVEASMDMQPMVVLTADRPAGLRGSGANQTIDQVDLYGKYVRYFCDLACPSRKQNPESLLRVIDEAMNRATATPPGPVHINCQFDEPLAPLGPDEDFSEYLAELKDWTVNGDPLRPAAPDENRAPSDKIASLAGLIKRSENGLLIVGALRNRTESNAVAVLAGKLGWPVLADIRSGLRLGPKHPDIVNHFDQLLLSEKFQQQPCSAILHLGSVMTSKRFNEWVSQSRIQNYIHIADHPFRHDPNNVVTEKIQSGIAEFCADLLSVFEKTRHRPDQDWIKRADDTAGKVVDGYIESDAALSEITVARLVSRHLAEGCGLFLGNSMPFRDMDMYGQPSGQEIFVTANRGASGIDGSIATAAGFAHGLKAPVTAVIGDLAFLHDVNSFPLVNAGRWPVTLVVINNNGGGIFSFLPVRECRGIFEDYFGTPHDLSIEKMAGAFDLDYCRQDDRDQFVDTYQRAQRSGRSSVIEIATDRENAYQQHRSLQELIRTMVDGLL